MSGHAHAHTHDSLFHRLTAPLKALYHKWYVPWIVAIAEQFGGRKDAGRLARTSRLIRLFANAITLTAVLQGIWSVGVSAFWAGGAVLPLGNFVLLGLGIVINTLGIALGSGANHLKIEQYYDAELEIHALTNELRPNKLRFPRDWNKITTKAVRTTHDLNGIAGSTVSWVQGLPEVLMFLSLPAYTISPVTASILFVVSRVSALVSAVGAWGTNQLRLWTYKQSLKTETDEYYALRASQNPQRHQQINQMIEGAFDSLSIDRNQKYSDWVYFRCYRAIESRFPREISDVTNILIGLLSPLVNSVKNIFDRKQLRQLSGRGFHESPVLDNMPLLEMKLFYGLGSEAPVSKNLLAYHVDVLRLERGLPNKDYPLTAEIDTNEVCESYPVAATAHGTSFLPYYHSRQLAREFVEQGQISPTHCLPIPSVGMVIP